MRGSSLVAAAFTLAACCAATAHATPPAAVVDDPPSQTPGATATGACPANQRTGMPCVDMSRVPAALGPDSRGGYDGKQPVYHSAVRVRAVSASAAEQYAQSDAGAFRVGVRYAMFKQVDPIVEPGVPKSMHLHAFFGNADVGADTTDPRTCHASTSFGGLANCTAYWVPAMIDTRTGTPIRPADAIAYYKSWKAQGNEVQPFPPGLRMVVGNAKATGPNNGPWRFFCVGPKEQGGAWDPGKAAGIPECKAGSELVMEISFPNCWNGRDLDSPNHISHMASTSTVCPSSHPVALPRHQLEVHYRVTAADDLRAWRLASDMYDWSMPGGFSAHGDWWNGWDADVMRVWVDNCLHRKLDCHANLLGDGRTLY